MKEKYLLSIKNAMFWHFTSPDIRDTLEELNTHFKSARNNGITDTEIIQEYGTPANFAKELLDELGQCNVKRKPVLLMKNLFLAACALLAFLSFILLPLNTALCVFVLCCPFIIWFFAGNSCILPVLETTEEKKRAYARSQILTLLLFLFLQVFSYFVIPGMALNGYTGMGRYASYIIYLLILILSLSALYFLKKMLDGNIYMFYIVVQDISMIASLFLYLGFLKNAETPENLEFILTPYFICLPVLLFYWIYAKYIVKHENADCT